MVKRFWALAAAVSLPLLVPTVAPAQQDEAPVYTYVAEWTVERPHWADFAAFLDKNTKPILNRLVSDGTILEWGSTENTIHTDEGYTHGVWWAAPSFAGTQRVLDELGKTGTSTGAQPGIVKHRDHLFRSVVFRSRHTGTTAGYLLTSYNVVKPGKAREWRELWEKNTKPVLENLLEQGAILGYGLDVEHVHTATPGARYGWIATKTADGVDKVDAALSAMQQKLTPEERRAMTTAYLEASDPEAHRDGLEKMVTYVRK